MIVQHNQIRDNKYSTDKKKKTQEERNVNVLFITVVIILNNISMVSVHFLFQP